MAPSTSVTPVVFAGLGSPLTRCEAKVTVSLLPVAPAPSARPTLYSLLASSEMLTVRSLMLEPVPPLKLMSGSCGSSPERTVLGPEPVRVSLLASPGLEGRPDLASRSCRGRP